MNSHALHTAVAGAVALISLAISAEAQGTLALSNTARAVGDDRWDWTVFLQGSPQALNEVQCVVYTLHPTFPNPVRRVCDRGRGPRAFALNSNGWGEFTIHAKVMLKNGRSQNIDYWLTLRETTPRVTQQGSPAAVRPSAAQSAALQAPPVRNASGCSVRVDLLIGEGSVRRIGASPTPLLLYAEEIHETSPSHFYLVSSAQPLSFVGDKLDTKTFLTLLERNNVHAATSSLTPETYARFSAGVTTSAQLTIQSGRLTVSALNAREHDSIEVGLCNFQSPAR